MRNKSIFMLAILMFLAAALSVQGKQTVIRTTGIGFRGTYWNSNFTASDFNVYHNKYYSEVNVGGGGGWLSFYSRINSNWLAEISLGGIGRVEAKSTANDSQFVHASVITPLVFGVRHELFSHNRNSGFQPYLSAGVGPYWFHDIVTKQEYHDYWDNDRHWHDDNDEDVEVSAKTKVMKGAYAGGGVNMALTSWMGLNFDVKYHFVDFDSKNKNSGYEFGLGLNFMWGRYRP
ncbi:outer membrane beta-barrel protein [candidate division KSB1 bacterium]|nr:outer membrane beta-barrel protein [candidate division KSB1 bacterium]